MANKSLVQNDVFTSVAMDLNATEKYFQENILVLLLYTQYQNFYMFALRLFNFTKTLF